MESGPTRVSVDIFFCQLSSCEESTDSLILLCGPAALQSVPLWPLAVACRAFQSCGPGSALATVCLSLDRSSYQVT